MGALIAVALVLLPLFGLWLYARDKRRDRETGSRSTGAGILRAGLLEMQNLLEPERKVEVLREADRKDDLLIQLDEEGDPEDTGRGRRGSRR
jgi:hypothetical protein